MIDGLNKHAQTIQSLVIAGATMTTKDIIEHLQARIDSAKGAQTTRATWQNAVKSDKDERAKSRGLLSGVKQALLVAFAGQIDTLADFGLNPRKPRVLSPEQKTTAATKARATRAARHTMGKKQKAAVQRHGLPGRARACRHARARARACACTRACARNDAGVFSLVLTP